MTFHGVQAHPGPPSRWDALLAGARLTDRLSDELRCAGRGLRVDSTVIPPTLIMKNVLARVLPDIMEAGAEPRPARSVVSAILASLRGARIGRVSALQVNPGPRRAARVLFVPRETGHFDLLNPVAAAVKARDGSEVHWLVFREHDRERCRTGGVRVVHSRVRALASARFIDLIGSLRYCGDAARRVARSEPLLQGREELWVRSILDKLGASLPAICAWADEIEKELDQFEPTVAVVGNPSTPEGRLLLELALRRGIPSVVVQHGTLVPGDPLWSDLPVSMFFTWGEVGQAALRANGYPESRLRIAGDPGSHAVPRAAAAKGTAVLVLLSGAGHLTGRKEHRELVETCAQAAARVPGREWRFRLHRKDDRALYLDAISRAGATNATVSTPGGDCDLKSDLSRAAVVITTTSTAAVEAMAADIVVVTIERPDGELIPDFVERGATVRAPRKPEGLARAIEHTLRSGVAEDIAERADAYVRSFFGSAMQDPARTIATEIGALGRGEIHGALWARRD